ncbi:hypothetical protein AB0K45_09630 [Micrococcus luteus]|uniref:hypothetical protein n=1 Tax=Micrococcus luteus TaxID=1270 RepID=UPI00342FA5EA
MSSYRPTRFAIGDRVIVANWKGADTPTTGMNGYYGHVVEVHPIADWVDVSLMGRVGAEARPHDLDPDGNDPWPFHADEVEHAD